MAAAICGPLPIQLIRYNSHDRLLGFHDARVFSTDFLSTFIDGGFWRFAPLTNWYWDRIHSPLSSSSVYLGMSVLFAIVSVYDQRRRIHRDARFWVGFAVLFWIVSLGPRFLILGQTHPTVPLPYALLEHLIPPLKLGGNPYRTIVLTTLAAGVIVAVFLSYINTSVRRGRLKMLLFCGVLALEMWPAQMPSTRAAHPRYVDVLKRLPGPGAVYDAAAPSPTWQLYYQTVHEKPIAGGYISRVPTSVNREDRALEAAVVAGQVSRLCSGFAIRYYTTPANHPIAGSQFPKIYSGPDALIYDLTRAGSCR